MKIITLLAALLILALFLAGCAKSGAEGLAGEAVKLKKDVAGTETISNPYAEKCDDGLDNDKDGLVDCQDVFSCYSAKSASQNICVGKGKADAGKILIIGTELGFSAKNAIKSHSNGSPYADGADACSSISKKCSHIEIYQNKEWGKEMKFDCGTRTNIGAYNLDKIYRAVCTGISGISTPPTASGEGTVAQ